MLKKKDLKESILIRSHGVLVRMKTNDRDAFREIIPILHSNLPGCEIDLSSDDIAEHEFIYIWNPSKLDALYKDGVKVSTRRRRNEALHLTGSQVRICIAEFAPDHVFIHAGVVAINGKAIVIPAKSMSGKSTLTAELVRLGAIYYSDEYAVIDRNGFVCPFPKDLSMREDGEFVQTDIPIEEFGGRQGTEPIPVEMILITAYKPNARWKPRELSPGQGFMELVSHTVPIRQNPTIAMERLSKIVRTSRIIKTKRADAAKTASTLFKMFNREYV